MRCEEFEQRLAGLSAGQLAGPEESLCLEHAGRCSKCAHLLATARGDRQVEAPAELIRNVLERTSGGICREARTLLCDRVDGTLPAGEGLLLERHLEACPQCRTLAESLSQCHSLLPELSEADPGLGFAETVFEKTSRRPRQSERPGDAVLRFVRSLFLRPRFALEAAYIGALLLFALYGLIPSQTIQPRLFAAGLVPAELHQSVTQGAATILTDLSAHGRKIEGRAASLTATAGQNLILYSTKTVGRLEEHYAGARVWLIETWRSARLRMDETGNAAEGTRSQP